MTRAQRMDAMNGFMVSILFTTVLVLLLGQASATNFMTTWTTTKMLWAVMVTGCLGISALAAISGFDSVRDALRVQVVLN